MEPAKAQLEQAIHQTKFQRGICPIYQNIDAMPVTAPEVIQEKLLQQLTLPVQWMQTIQHMIQDGTQHFVECGPGKTLKGLLKRIDKTVQITSL
jgi:[acyl-carrier-protein] S-malonyltransferase